MAAWLLLIRASLPQYAQRIVTASPETMAAHISRANTTRPIRFMVNLLLKIRDCIIP